MVTQGGEDVAQLALARGRIAHSVGGQERQFQGMSDFDRCMIARFLLAMKMALQFNIDIFMPENLSQALHHFPAF